MTHICHVISNIDLSAGGPARAVLGLAGAQVAVDGVRVSLISPKATNDRVEESLAIADGRFDVRLIENEDSRLLGSFALTRALHELIAVSDIVHIHALWEPIQRHAARIARRMGKPYIFRPCGMLDPWSLSQRRWRKQLYLDLWLRRSLNQSAAIHYTAELERDAAAAVGLTAPTIIEPNGLDFSEFVRLPPRGSFRASWGIEPDRPLVVFLGRLHPKKGIDLLIPAMARLKRTDAMLVFVGAFDTPGYEQSVRAMVSAEGLEQRVVFTGQINGIDRVAPLVDADLFCLPSYQENFGIAIIEALAAGTPAVISDQVNIWRELQAVGAAAVVEPRIEPLVEMLDQWLDDPDRRAAAGQAGRRFVLARYDWNRIAERWIGHYRRLLDERPTAR